MKLAVNEDMIVRWLRNMMQAIVLVWLVTAGCAPLQAAPHQTLSLLAHTLDATHDDSPTWESLGLEDLLVPVTECSMAAPQSTPAHQGGATQNCGNHYAAMQPFPATRQLHPRPLRVFRPNDYYLYFLYRLRL